MEIIAIFKDRRDFDMGEASFGSIVICGFELTDDEKVALNECCGAVYDNVTEEELVNVIGKIESMLRKENPNENK